MRDMGSTILAVPFDIPVGYMNPRHPYEALDLFFPSVTWVVSLLCRCCNHHGSNKR